jgi:hypothetical protein
MQKPQFKIGRKIVFIMKHDIFEYPIYTEVQSIIHTPDGFLYRLPGVDGAIDEKDLRSPTDEEWSDFFLGS